MENVSLASSDVKLDPVTLDMNLALGSRKSRKDKSKDESTEELPPSADENRQVGPVGQDHDAQGGPTESKLVSVDGGDRQHAAKSSSLSGDVVTEAARKNFAKFHDMKVADVDTSQIESTSLGIDGWANSSVLDNAGVDKERVVRETVESGCC